MATAGKQEAMTPVAEDPVPSSEPAANKIVEKGDIDQTSAPANLDIEHAVVADDPRKWSRTRKVRSYLPFLLERTKANDKRLEFCACDCLRRLYDSRLGREHLQS